MDSEDIINDFIQNQFLNNKENKHIHKVYKAWNEYKRNFNELKLSKCRSIRNIEDGLWTIK